MFHCHGARLFSCDVRCEHLLFSVCQILIDTKSIQKEINTLTGKLDRTFTVADELIFRVSLGHGSVRL